MHEKESQSSIRTHNPTHHIQPVYYAKAIRWLANYLTTNDALLSRIFSCQQNFLPTHNQLCCLGDSKSCPYSLLGVTTNEGLMTMVEILQQEQAPSKASKIAIDWLRFHVRQDKELQAIILNLYDPSDPPFYHFVAWTLKRQLLKAPDKNRIWQTEKRSNNTISRKNSFNQGLRNC